MILNLINKLNYVTNWSGNAELLAENYWEQQQITNSTKLRTFQTCVITSVMIYFNISTKGEQVRNWKIKFWPQNKRFFASCNFRCSSDDCIMYRKHEGTISKDFPRLYIRMYLIWRVKIFLPKLILGNCWIKGKLVKALIVKTGVEIEKNQNSTLCPISS